MLRGKGVGVTKVYRTGRLRHNRGNGVGLHRGDVGEYDATCSDVNGERSVAELGVVRVVNDQEGRVAPSAA